MLRTIARLRRSSWSHRPCSIRIPCFRQQKMFRFYRGRRYPIERYRSCSKAVRPKKRGSTRYVYGMSQANDSGRCESCLDRMRTDVQSWFNTGEISVVVNTIQSLLHDVPSLQQREIAVMSPWREQVWRIRARLRRVGLRGIDVGNVEVSRAKYGTDKRHIKGKNSV